MASTVNTNTTADATAEVKTSTAIPEPEIITESVPEAPQAQRVRVSIESPSTPQGLSKAEGRRFAFTALLVALVVGAAGSLMFLYQGGIGLSFPIFAAVCIAALLLTARFTGRPVNRRNLWPLAAALFFAAWVAIRASESLTMLNILMALTMGGLALAFIPMKQFIDKSTFAEHAVGTLSGFMATGLGAFAELPLAWGYIRHNGLGDRRALVAVLRGLALTLPILLIFAALLSSADAVFNSYTSGLLSFQGFERFADQTVSALILGWLALGGIAYGLNPYKGMTVEQKPAPSRKNGALEPADLETLLSDGEVADAPMPETAADVNAAAMNAESAKRKRAPFLLSVIEAGMVLGGLIGLFGVFVFIQFSYFFGGEANVLRGGFTYSEYARRGFFELLAVSILTLGLLLFLDWVTILTSKTSKQVFRGLALGVVALMGVMIYAASQRMELYETAYGFTHMRVLPHLFIWAIGALFIAFALQLFRVREQIFSLGLLLTAIGYLTVLNVMNLDLYIANRNIERFVNGEGVALDFCYLRSLSVDALPAILALGQRDLSGLQDPEWSAEDVTLQVNAWLRDQQYAAVNRHANRTIFAANLSLDSAYSTLAGLEIALPDYSESVATGCWGDPLYR